MRVKNTICMQVCAGVTRRQPLYVPHAALGSHGRFTCQHARAQQRRSALVAGRHSRRGGHRVVPVGLRRRQARRRGACGRPGQREGHWGRHDGTEDDRGRLAGGNRPQRGQEVCRGCRRRPLAWSALPAAAGAAPFDYSPWPVQSSARVIGMTVTMQATTFSGVTLCRSILTKGHCPIRSARSACTGSNSLAGEQRERHLVALAALLVALEHGACGAGRWRPPSRPPPR